jgi:hypothetical protein
MKIYVPFKTVAKSLFVAKDKITDELKLVFYTPMKNGLFFVHRNYMFNSDPLNDKQLANLDFYPIEPFFNQLLDLIKASKNIEKKQFAKVCELISEYPDVSDTFDNILSEVKIEREISHGIKLFLNDCEELIEYNDIQPISCQSIIKNSDKYQIALAWAFYVKDIGSFSFHRISDFLRTFLYSMANNDRTNEFVFDVPFIERPRKAKLLLRLTAFEKFKSYFGALI